MTWLGRLHKLCKQDRAGIAALAAIFLTTTVALTGAAVDIGMMASVRSELQNAADASALAGAGTLISWDASNSALAQPETALAEAQAMAYQNTSQGINLQLALEDITLGLWQEDAHAFDPDHIGATSDPNNISACRVIIRRDVTINSPVPTIFLGILGIDTVNVSAISTGHLGWAGTAGAGQVDLPIAVKEDALTGSGLICGQEITFRNEANENGEWTTFFTYPSNDPAVRGYVDGSDTVPALEVGNQVAVTNGTLSQQTFDSLNSRFQSEGTDLDGDGTADWWQVILPVISSGDGGASTAEIAGFANMVIHEVRGAPDKEIIASLQCGMVVPDSKTGGGNFGSRAATPVLVE
ncbi:MAG: hypothetical protein K9K66_08320 [Desulfarculaceae bacterium]|nr:hypothetical protein [Desulfarculaceae bacterium]MCF8071324.1 hypothetical protein [Desulfarculaceae bacterium]MCF8101649.1 hypothetical protein [Desulfarculaceae bacterium]MCF8116742.1 hypothetical protein [Desulfarculaceae bacterium]